MDTDVSEPAPTAETAAAPAAPEALRNLHAAGLASHEMLGDPSRLGTEAATLRALCGLVAGSVWRLDPYHYAFRPEAGDAGGRLGDLAPEDWAAALEAALAETLGPDAVWVNALQSGAPDEGLEAPVAHLRAFAAAAAEGRPEPGLSTVLSARFAVETARLAAGETPGGTLDLRLARIEAQVDQMAALMARPPEPVPDPVMAEALVSVLARLEALETGVAALPGEGGLAAFQETVGLALAEFLARIERDAGRAGGEAAAGSAAPMTASGQ